MTDIAVGATVKLVKAPASWEPLPARFILAETGMVMGWELSTETGFEKLYRVKFTSGQYWLAGENIEEVDPRGNPPQKTTSCVPPSTGV